MMTGATRVAPELTSIAITATMICARSSATSGRNRLSPARSELLAPNGLVLSSLYFIVVRAPLRIVNLHVFRGGLQQFAVSPPGQDLSFHQKDDLIVVLDGRDLLRDRDQRDSGVLFLNVLEDRLFRRGVDSRGKIIEQ